MQKITAILIGYVGFATIGYSLWNIQFYQAAGSAHAIASAIADWMPWGSNVNTFAHRLDPSSVPGADDQQILLVFFGLFGATAAAFIHGAGLERMKPLATYLLAAVASAIAMPIAAYLSFGPSGPLSNIGVHDFIGIYPLYLTTGCWGVVIAARLGRRQQASAVDFRLYAAGAFLSWIGIPLFVASGGYLVVGKGYFGLTLSESGLGIVFLNVFAAIVAGGLMGSLIAYRKRAAHYVIMGTLTGFIATSGLMDVATPWKTFVVAMFAPLISIGTSWVLRHALDIDEPKMVSLALGPSVYGALATGVVASGIPTGGALDVLKGPYTFQHARITLSGQTIGVAVIAAFALCTAWLTVVVVDRLIGLRISSEQEREGLDRTYWQ